MRRFPLLLLLAACTPADDDSSVDDDTAADDDSTADDDTSTDDDTAGDDDSSADDDTAGDDDSAGGGPDWSLCPGPETAVGDPSWPGTLSVAPDALLCAFPRMWTPLADVQAQKVWVHLTAGDYPLPLDVAGEPYRIPACFWSEEEGLEIAGEGSVEAGPVEDFTGNHQLVTGSFPLADDRSFELRVELAPGATSAEIRSDAPFDGGIGGSRCVGAECFGPEDVLLAPCAPPANLCDSITFDRGEIHLDQHHWAGSVGAGFAALVRARGSIDGTAFDVRDYGSLDMGYGHHAFSRGAVVRFEAPIGEVCAIRLSDVTEYGAAGALHELIGCDGSVIDTLDVEGDAHSWGAACP